jgi:mono/diheme cytochrome c family protein
VTRSSVRSIAVALALFSLAACGEQDDGLPQYSTVDPHAAGLPGQPGCDLPARASYRGDCARGKEQYDIVCATCHGPDGKGPRGPLDPLSPLPRDMSDTAYMGDFDDKDLYYVIQCGGLAVGKSAYMPAWTAAISSDGIADVVCHLRSLSGT